MNFEGKRVLVTGGSRGIGRATVEAFREAGARVAVNGRTAESTAEGIAAMNDDGLIAAPGDISTVAGCEAVVGAALDALGGLDVLVNSAGVAKARSVETCDEAFWDEMMDINLKGTFFCIRAAATALRESRGSIVNVASVSGHSGLSGMADYNSAKAAVRHLSKSVALHCARAGNGIRCNSIHPVFIDTPILDSLAGDGDKDKVREKLGRQIPLGRIGEPDDVAFAVLYLASDESKFVTGTEIRIDGGISAM